MRQCCFQWTGRRIVLAFLPFSWMVIMLPWVDDGEPDGTLIASGPFRFGWR